MRAGGRGPFAAFYGCASAIKAGVISGDLSWISQCGGRCPASSMIVHRQQLAVRASAWAERDDPVVAAPNQLHGHAQMRRREIRRSPRRGMTIGEPLVGKPSERGPHRSRRPSRRL